MDHNLQKNEKSHMLRDELNLIRIEKLRKEIEAARRLLESKIEPLKVADDFIHNMFKLLIDGISKSNPKFNQKEINQKVNESLAFSEKIKNFRKRGKKSWQK